MHKLRLITSLLTISDPPTNVLPQAIPKWKKSLLPQTQGNKILLLKRSEKVSTYQQHWGGITGSLEPSDKSCLQRALADIKEKTGFSEHDLHFIRTGKPLKINNNGVEGLVHPYLFKIVTDPKKIKLDSENSEVSFVEPQKINDYQIVPQLKDIIDRVYLPDKIHTGLYELQRDRSSGALEYTWKSLALLKVATEETPREKFDNLNQTFLYLLNIAHHISVIRPTMSTSIINVVSVILNDAKNFIDTHGSSLDHRAEFQESLSNSIKTYLDSATTVQKRINRNAIQYLFPMFDPNYIDQNSGIEPDYNLSILTTSFSSTILKLLLALCHAVHSSPKPYTLQVTILESRPLNEGALYLAQRLNDYINSNNLRYFPNTKNQRIRITVITDSSVAYYLKTKKVTYCLLGADRVVGEDGSVVNKMGSACMAMAANYYHEGEVPVFVVTQRDKIGEDEDEINMEENEASEVTSSYGQWWTRLSDQFIEVRNVYFEKVDPRLISGYLMEDGLIGLEEMRKIWFTYKKARIIFDML
jgi:translation initiation factor 2B subunit (eIF-2B alpha/beta/delta family)